MHRRGFLERGCVHCQKDSRTHNERCRLTHIERCLPTYIVRYLLIHNERCPLTHFEVLHDSKVLPFWHTMTRKFQFASPRPNPCPFRFNIAEQILATVMSVCMFCCCGSLMGYDHQACLSCSMCFTQFEVYLCDAQQQISMTAVHELIFSFGDFCSSFL